MFLSVAKILIITDIVQFFCREGLFFVFLHRIMEPDRHYIAIDLKSFYASVECVDLGLNPLTTNLVVADAERTEKTICLAVTPALKAFGIPGRARLFEVVEKVRKLNMERLCASPEGTFTGRSYDSRELQDNAALEMDFRVVPPRMAHYMRVSAQIYGIYLRYVAPEDIQIYSIDEVFIDATEYLRTYHMSARDLASKMVSDVYRDTGITATAGTGTNIYLAKVAMDIGAKHCKPDSNGVRIAELDEQSFRQQLWGHRPLTDFWRLGKGTARRLEALGLNTMGDIARYSLTHEQDLFRLFGVAAELIIDHAWGWEPTTIAEIKNYRSMSNSVGNGQVFPTPYTADKARLVAREMANVVADELAERGATTDQMVLYVGYDTENLTNPDIASRYKGEVGVDYYGRTVPLPANGSANLNGHTTSARIIGDAIVALFDRIVNPILTIRRLNVAANNVLPLGKKQAPARQLNIFDNPDEVERQQQAEQKAAERERRMQQAELAIRKRFGSNSIIRGTDFEEGATRKQRNGQVGGHRM